MKRRKQGQRNYKITFYVFYDRNDFVKFCGTAEDLVKEGRFKNVGSVQSTATHQNERRPNSVVRVTLPKGARRSVYNA